MVFCGMLHSLNKIEESNSEEPIIEEIDIEILKDTTKSVYFDLSTPTLVEAQGFTINAEYKIYSGNNWGIERFETVPGTDKVGAWMFYNEHWWDSRSPNAFAFFKGGTPEGYISLTLNEGGIYIFVVGCPHVHKDTSEIEFEGVPNSVAETFRFMLNNTILYTSYQKGNERLQQSILVIAQPGDIITLIEGTFMAMIYGMYKIKNSITINFSSHIYFGLAPTEIGTWSNWNKYVNFKYIRIYQDNVNILNTNISEYNDDNILINNIGISGKNSNPSYWDWWVDKDVPQNNGTSIRRIDLWYNKGVPNIYTTISTNVYNTSSNMSFAIQTYPNHFVESGLIVSTNDPTSNNWIIRGSFNNKLNPPINNIIEGAILN